MANEIENALKSAATSAAQYVKDAAELVVETRIVEIGKAAADFSKAEPAARTVIKLDGDCETVLPMRPGPTGAMEVDTGLFELHQKNVDKAIEYRSRILDSLLEALTSIVPGS